MKTFKELFREKELNEAKSKEDLIKYYEKNLKNVEKQYSTDSRKQEYIDYAKGQLNAVKKDGINGLIKFLKDWNMNESPGKRLAKNVKNITQEEAVEVISKLFGKDKKLDEFFLSFFKKNFTYAVLSNTSKKWEDYKDELENEDNAHLVQKLYTELYTKYRTFLDSAF